jgi:hypothetical protein
MEQALTRPSNCSIVSALDIHDRQVRQQALTGRTGEQAGWPKNVTLQQYQGAYSIPGGTEIKKVGLHYDGPTAGSTKVGHLADRCQMLTLAEDVPCLEGTFAP